MCLLVHSVGLRVDKVSMMANVALIESQRSSRHIMATVFMEGLSLVSAGLYLVRIHHACNLWCYFDNPG